MSHVSAADLQPKFVFPVAKNVGFYLELFGRLRNHVPDLAHIYDTSLGL